jgi:integrase
VEFRKHIDNRTDAEKAATAFRAAIDAGTFRRRHQLSPPSIEQATTASTVVTLDAFAKTYIERVSQASGKESWNSDKAMLTVLGNHRMSDGTRLGDIPLAAVTEDELEAFFAALIAAGRAANTRNHYVRLIKAAFRWAAKKGYLSRSPISDDSALTRSKGAQRSRRVTTDDEAALLKAAQTIKRNTAVWLYGLIIAALETGCRLGEMLAFKWSDVDLERKEIRVRSETAKDDEMRRLPISTRLSAVLDMAKTDPSGREYPHGAHVFGVLGEQVSNISKAWSTCVLRAHGYEPIWKAGKLARESRAALKVVDLHFHDLRHEAGSRWLEAGWPLHHVRAMLGHSNVSQTDTYLNAGRMGLHESMKRFDANRTDAVQTPQTTSDTGIRGTSMSHEATREHRPECHTPTANVAEPLIN